MANLFTSALSGMNTAQLGLATTEHNISNASTPGFTRQQILPVARLGQQTGSGFVGQGADVQNVTRIYDQYLSAQVLQEQSQATNLTTYYTALKQIDNLVADPAAGASPAMQSFFDAMSAVSNNPESIPARQTLFGNAQFAINRFQAIDQRMTDMANGLNGQITSSINAVNNPGAQQGCAGVQRHHEHAGLISAAESKFIVGRASIRRCYCDKDRRPISAPALRV